MSALKHGFFRVGFMLCDRCGINARCERFSPGAECGVEKEAYDWFVKELVKQYGLEGLADQILVERATMYLLRIVRAEMYESLVGVSEKSVLWGGYISRLDNALRGLLNDLAVTRLKRKQLERGEALMVSVEDLLKRLAKRTVERERREYEVREPMIKLRKTGRRWVLRVRPTTVYSRILADWRMEKQVLLKKRTAG